MSGAIACERKTPFDGAWRGGFGEPVPPALGAALGVHGAIGQMRAPR